MQGVRAPLTTRIESVESVDMISIESEENKHNMPEDNHIFSHFNF